MADHSPACHFELGDSITLGHQLGPKQPAGHTTTVDQKVGYPLGYPPPAEQSQPVGSETTAHPNLEQTIPDRRDSGEMRHKWKIPTGFKSVKSAKVWFVHTNIGHDDLQILSYLRKGKRASYDTFGGTRDIDDPTVTGCLLRELQEEVAEMPDGWWAHVTAAVDQYPKGHNAYESVKWKDRESHHTTVWFVCVPSGRDLPTMSLQFAKEEGDPGSLKWRSARDIIENLNQFVFHQSLVLILRRANWRHQKTLSQIERPIGRKIDSKLIQQRKGLIGIHTGLGMVVNSCVQNGSAVVLATYEPDDLCHRVMKHKYGSAEHYRNVLEVSEDTWAAYRWDSKRPLHTAYTLVIGLPRSPSMMSRQERGPEDPRFTMTQCLVRLTKCIQPRLVITENATSSLHQESWVVLQSSFGEIGYSIAHTEIMEHSMVGGATDCTRVFHWFQINKPGIPIPFPRDEPLSLFESPPIVIRDHLDHSGYPTNPQPLRARLRWKDPVEFLVGQPACIGYLEGKCAPGGSPVFSPDGIAPAMGGGK